MVGQVFLSCGGEIGGRVGIGVETEGGALFRLERGSLSRSLSGGVFQVDGCICRPAGPKVLPQYTDCNGCESGLSGME